MSLLNNLLKQKTNIYNFDSKKKLPLLKVTKNP